MSAPHNTDQSNQSSQNFSSQPTSIQHPTYPAALYERPVYPPLPPPLHPYYSYPHYPPPFATFKSMNPAPHYAYPHTPPSGYMPPQTNAANRTEENSNRLENSKTDANPSTNHTLTKPPTTLHTSTGLLTPTTNSSAPSTRAPFDTSTTPNHHTSYYPYMYQSPTPYPYAPLLPYPYYQIPLPNPPTTIPTIPPTAPAKDTVQKIAEINPSTTLTNILMPNPSPNTIAPDTALSTDKPKFQPLNQSATKTMDQTTNRSINQSTNQSINQSTTQSTTESTTQATTLSMTESPNQSTITQHSYKPVDQPAFEAKSTDQSASQTTELIPNLETAPDTIPTNPAKRQKMTFGFSSPAPARLQFGNALRSSAHPAQPTPAKATKLEAKPRTAIESLKKELERHKPNVATPAKSIVRSEVTENYQKNQNAVPYKSSEIILKKITEPEKIPDPQPAPKKVKSHMEEDIDDMLRQILPAQMRKELPIFGIDEKTDVSGSLFSDSESEGEPEIEIEPDDDVQTVFGKEDPIWPEMEKFMRQVYLREFARERKPDFKTGVVDEDGDIFNSDCDVFIHCCNCFHTMSAGIAKRIKTELPEAYSKDAETPHGDKRKIGHFSSVLTTSGVTIVNMYAQFAYGSGRRHLDYNALEIGLSRLLSLLRSQNVFPKIGTYYMGCYRAGGDIEVVKKIFDSVFTDRLLHVYNQEKRRR